MFRIITAVGALLAVGAVLSAVSPAASENDPFPEVIQLPTGFRPEGIEVGRGTTFYVGSVANGAIYQGDLRTGTGAILVPGAAGKAATGIELDSRNRLFVAGAATGTATVYNAPTRSARRRRSSTTSWSRPRPLTSPIRRSRCSTAYLSGRPVRLETRRRST
jgi:hypothetical protein